MVIKPNRVHEFEEEARQLISHKGIYQEVEAATTAMAGRIGVKWYHVAVIHMREASADFHCYLGNGQSLARRTTEVPAGRGPFTGPHAFLKGCIDALHVDGLDSVADWRLEKILFYCELFNGTGYNARGLPSPYLWGGTSVQRPGKYVADRKFNARVWDNQPGCAPLLATMAKFDPTIAFQRED